MKRVMTWAVAAGVALPGSLALISATPSFAFGTDRNYVAQDDSASVRAGGSADVGQVQTARPIQLAARHVDSTKSGSPNSAKAQAHQSEPARTQSTKVVQPMNGRTDCWHPASDQAPGLGYWGSCSTPGAVPMK